MNNNTLKNLLIEYDKKKIRAEEMAQREKQKIYDEFPALSEIDQKLSSLALSTMKELALNNNEKLLKDFNKKIEELKKEKEKILASIGDRAQLMQPQYECKKCKDTGYILDGNSTKMCSCLTQKIYDIEYNKSNIHKVDPQKYESDISPRENIELILKICKDFIQHFDDVEEKNLLFTGKTGLGKTFLSSCIANELLKQGKTVLYQTASVMLDTIIGYRFGKPNIPSDIYDHLLNVDLLIIDDLGTEGVNNMKLVELFNIINSRLLNTHKSTKTIISTNLSLQSLFETYDERIVSRLVGNYHICYFFGEDIRFTK